MKSCIRMNFEHFVPFILLSVTLCYINKKFRELNEVIRYTSQNASKAVVHEAVCVEKHFIWRDQSRVQPALLLSRDYPYKINSGFLWCRYEVACMGEDMTVLLENSFKSVEKSIIWV